MYADELTPESVYELQQLSKKLWLAAFKKVVRAAQDAIERDGTKPVSERNMRMRFGSYFFGEEVQPAAADPAPERIRELLPREWPRLVRSALVGLCSMLISCGGAEDPQIAGVGNGGTGIGSGIASGTVTGFGSVIVDGDRWDDRQASVEVEISPAAGTMLSEVMLGQRVEIGYTEQGLAATIRISAELIGIVTEVRPDRMSPYFKLLAGQTVRVITDPGFGPVTVWAGYESMGDLRANHIVEVHGMRWFDPTIGHNVILASRVQKREVLPGGLTRVAGMIEQLNPAGNAFRLGDLLVRAGTASIYPSGGRLANGSSVIVWSSQPLAGTPSAPILNADFVRLRDPAASSNSGQRIELSGLISNLNLGNSSFSVSGYAVNASDASVEPANQTLLNGQYVKVRGTLTSSGSVDATRVKIRRSSNPSRIELSGTIRDYVSDADFRVRKVFVDATSASRSGCPRCSPTDWASRSPAAWARADASRPPTCAAGRGTTDRTPGTGTAAARAAGRAP